MYLESALEWGGTSKVLSSENVPRKCFGVRMYLQYNFIAKCQYIDCTRNVLWCQVHSSHIHSNHKT